jgi:hypothetical protein
MKNVLKTIQKQQILNGTCDLIRKRVADTMFENNLIKSTNKDINECNDVIVFVKGIEKLI